MARLVVFNAIIFLLPFAIFAGWLIATRGSANNAADWPLKTIGFLAIGGAVLMVAALLIFVHLSGASPEATYRPATIDQQGRIVPGTLE
jgi:TRAP-type C4-dicarboxylate transport system permease large subunit